MGNQENNHTIHDRTSTLQEPSFASAILAQLTIFIQTTGYWLFGVIFFLNKKSINQSKTLSIAILPPTYYL